MMPAAAAILDGMPEPGDLHRVTADGTTWILAGPVPLFSYPEADAGMRNIAVVTLRQLGYPGQAVADLMGLSECYVATLRSRALREGTAGVVRQPGARRKLTGAKWGEAAVPRRGGPPARRAAQAYRGVVGAGALVAGRRRGGRGDRPQAGGGSVDGAAPPGPPRCPAGTGAAAGGA